LELEERVVARSLQLLLELLQMHLAVADALLPPRDLDGLLLELALALRDPLLDLRDLDPAILNLAVDLRPKLHRELSGLDLRLPPDGLRLAVRVGDRPPALLLAPPDRRAARRAEPHCGRARPDRDTDERGDEREHLHSSRSWPTCRAVRRGSSHPTVPRPGGVPTPLRRVALGRCGLQRTRTAHPLVGEVDVRHEGHRVNGFGTTWLQELPE